MGDSSDSYAIAGIALRLFIIATMLERGTCQIDEADVPTLSRKLRYILFPDLSTMGLYAAVSIPLTDLADYQQVAMSFNFEANYPLPSNYTELVVPYANSGTSRADRQITRRRTYDVIEKRFHSYGLDGRQCLLRTICDTSASLLDNNGLLGDLLHLIFTPSTSAKENLAPEFDEAELNGKNGLDCQLLYPKCRMGLLDIITKIQDSEYY